MGIKSLTTLALLGGAFLTSWAGVHDKELADIKAGTRAEAKASWWGFDKQDSTAALQAAINSGVKRLIVDNTGNDWVVEPIKLVDNQEIVFEKEVVVVAKKGAFKALTAALFTAAGKKNITLRGQGGVILKMRKADYHDAASYTPGEWRHGISLLSCENIAIRDLTVLSSGGDGIYVGCQGGNPMNYCKDILVDGVVADDHNRQGISVISVENLTIRNSVFKNTRGAAPESGIDFEPNLQTERLVNCVVENCVFTGNNGGGVEFYLRTNFPLSISIKNCKITGNTRGISHGLVRGQQPVSENIEFVNCFVGFSSSANVYIQGANTSFRFKDCVIDNNDNPLQAITIMERGDHPSDGVVAFENVNVIDNAPGHVPLAVSSYLGKPKLTIKGSINFTHPGMVSSLLDCAKKLEPAYEGEFKVAPPVDTKKLVAPEASASTGMADAIIPVRYEGKFIQFAEQGRKLAFEAMGVKVGKNGGKISMCVKSPKGVEVMKFELEPDCSWRDLAGVWKRMEFTPEETGIYTVECVKNNGNAFRLRSSAPGNGYLVEDEFHAICPKGKLFFQVPIGAKDIKIEVAGDQGEPLDASLVDPKGMVVRGVSNVEAPKLLSWTRADSSKSEIWAVEFSHAVEDSFIRMGEPLVPVLSEKPEWLPLLP